MYADDTTIYCNLEDFNKNCTETEKKQWARKYKHIAKTNQTVIKCSEN